MAIVDLERGLTFIRDEEVGRFLVWIANQNYNGPINLSSTGYITIREILEYIERKTGKKAIIDIQNGIGVKTCPVLQAGRFRGRNDKP